MTQREPVRRSRLELISGLPQNITDWRRSDLEGLLLAHFPRKVSLEDDDLLRVAPDVDEFLTFLDQDGLLSGAPLAELRASSDALLPEFVDAMQDPTRYGMAKRLVAQMHGDGVDIRGAPPNAPASRWRRRRWDRRR